MHLSSSGQCPGNIGAMMWMVCAWRAVHKTCNSPSFQEAASAGLQACRQRGWRPEDGSRIGRPAASNVQGNRSLAGETTGMFTDTEELLGGQEQISIVCALGAVHKICNSHPLQETATENLEDMANGARVARAARPGVAAENGMTVIRAQFFRRGVSSCVNDSETSSRHSID